MNFLNTVDFEIKKEVISSDVLCDASSVGLFHECSPLLKKILFLFYIKNRSDFSSSLLIGHKLNDPL